MCQSLIDSIGRESALKLIDDAVLHAIEENDSSGVLRKAKTAEVVDSIQCVGGDGRRAALVAVRSPALDRSAKKSLLHDESGPGLAGYR
ncbi:hypothetical protein LT722_24535 [Pseudomonas syringae pv. syringae]|jgi:hypothetical protein|uniref:hypothetical protein n=1 Tax=Pseudomonas syringae TaxID=317 RepID=UPI00200AC4C8|nr:hypothetical protein [Pseudomonas syringae]MCK9719401.1 hypothetical protein [Pseudomonas syringae pv. syringae]MCK9764794.1 hypothetical protein [Pseudomonas syringae pv. syringae]